MSENPNMYDARKALKKHIKFLETILGHLNFGDNQYKKAAMVTAWCLNNYMNNQLNDDIQKAVIEHGDKPNE